MQESAPGGVLAVLVSAGVTPYLPETLRALSDQSLAPEVLLIVDVASRANGLGDGTPIEEAVVASGVDDFAAVRVVHAPEATGFGDAVKRGLAKYAELIAKGNRRRRRRGADRHIGTQPTDCEDASAAASATGSGPLTGPTGAMSPISEAEVRGVSRINAPAEEAFNGSWLWLLHDDSAPGPDCLACLLAAVRTARSVALAGPKQVDWDRPHELLEVGLRTTASARRANDVVEGEVDQGQYDDRSDMLAVGSAGALIDRVVWDELDGTSCAFPIFDDGLELSRAVRLAGHRVVVVPNAIIRHRRASYLGLRPGQRIHGSSRAGQDRGSGEPLDLGPPAAAAEPDPDRSFRARRVAQLTAWATFSARPVWMLRVWFLMLGLARAAWRLLTKAPALARDELAAALAVAGRTAAIRSGRRRLAEHQEVRRSVLAELYVSAGDIRASRRDRRRQERERAAREAARSELELRELAALTRRRRLGLACVMIVVTAVAAVGLSQILVTRTVMGGALPGLGAGWRELWDAAWSTWAVSGDGYPAAISPLLAVLAPPVAVGSWFGLDGDALMHLLLVLAIPLAALGAWYAAGTITRRNPLRAWAACVWALAPALLLAVGQGRLTAVIIHLALPWALTALARALGTDRRDVILSGMIGAHHATQAEKDELDRFAAETIEDLAELADDTAAEQAPDRAADSASVADDTAAEDEVIPVYSDAVADAAMLDPDAPVLRPTASTEDAAAPEPGTSVQAAERSVDAPSGTDPADAGDSHGSGAHGTDSESTDTGTAAAQAAGTEAAVMPPEGYGPGSPTAAAVAGLLLSLIVAVAPVTAVLSIGGLILLAVCVRRSAPRLLLTLLPVVATAAPAWWRALRLAQAGDPGDALRYLLTDTGLPVAVAPPSTIETLLGMPVDVESLLSDPALALTAKVLLAFVPAAAVCGLLTGGRRGNRARAGFVLALGGLGLTAVGTRVVTAVGTHADGTGSLTVTAWAGTGVSFALAGLLAAALVAGDAAYAASPVYTAGWRRWVRVGLIGVSAIVFAAPLTVGAAWAVAARSSTATGGDAEVMALQPASSRIPVIATEIQASDTAGRVLILSATDAGLRARIWRGDGTQLADVTPDVLAAQFAARVAADETAPTVGSIGAPGATTTLTTVLNDPADAELADLVVRAAAGQDESVADSLAAHGIAVVLLTDSAGDDLTASTRAGLEATPGLEQLARTGSGTSWRVAPAGATDSARVMLVDAAGTATSVPSAGTGRTVVRTRLEAGAGRRLLILAERNDGAWRATLNGEPLQSSTLTDATGRWRTAFVVPADGGELIVTHGTALGAVAAGGIGLVWAVTALAALPLRRRRSTV